MSSDYFIDESTDWPGTARALVDSRRISSPSCGIESNRFVVRVKKEISRRAAYIDYRDHQVVYRGRDTNRVSDHRSPFYLIELVPPISNNHEAKHFLDTDY